MLIFKSSGTLSYSPSVATMAVATQYTNVNVIDRHPATAQQQRPHLRVGLLGKYIQCVSKKPDSYD